MNKTEWDATCGWMEACFKGKITDEQETTYARFLQDRSRQEVMDAIDKLVLEGQVFMPLPGQMVQAMRPALPSFTDVWHQIEPVLRDATVHGERRCVELVRERAGDLVAGWVATYGAVRLALEPQFDPEYGGAVIQRLQRAWKEATASHEQRTLTAAAAQRLLDAPRRTIMALPAAA